VEKIAERGAPVMANRVLACVRRMLNFAIDHDWIDANPAARVQKPGREVSRDRVLADEEIRRLWRCLSPPLRNGPLRVATEPQGRNRIRSALSAPR